MSKDKKGSNEVYTVFSGSTRLIMPLIIEWQPKEDITTYELALCMPYLLINRIMPSQVDLELPHFRHFKITDPNQKA